MSTEEMKVLVRRKYEHYRQCDIDKSLALFPAFTDFKVIVEKQVAEGNMVTSYWRMSGKHTGELLGIPPTGKEVMVTGMTIDEVKNGKVIECGGSMDIEGFLKQVRSMLTQTP